jgi:hypothetical protein
MWRGSDSNSPSQPRRGCKLQAWLASRHNMIAMTTHIRSPFDSWWRAFSWSRGQQSYSPAGRSVSLGMIHIIQENSFTPHGCSPGWPQRRRRPPAGPVPPRSGAAALRRAPLGRRCPSCESALSLAAARGAHGAIKACFLVLMTCVHTRTDSTTPSVPDTYRPQGPDTGPKRSRVHCSTKFSTIDSTKFRFSTKFSTR